MATPPGMKPADVGVFLDAHDIGILHEPLRSRISTMFKDCPQPMALVSGFRSPWQQWLIRHERCPGNEFSMSACPGNPRAAVPYSSNHQKGTAADIGGSGMAWCLARIGKYGLKRTVASENWHLEAVGTPTVTIRPYGTKPPAYHAPSATTPVGGITKGDVGEVLWLQDHLNLFRAHQSQSFIKRDGQYGPQCTRAVTEFQVFFNAMNTLAGSKAKPWATTGIAGPLTISGLLFWDRLFFPAS